MVSRRLASAGMVTVALACLVVIPAVAQVTGKAPAGGALKPDLNGLWNNTTLTPLERPRDLADKPYFTEPEAQAYEKRLVEAQTARPPANPVADPEIWWERGSKVVSTRRTSLIIDPPDGRLPALTPAARSRAEMARAETMRHPADGPRDRSLQERCLLEPNSGPPFYPGPYNNNYQIVQTPHYVMFASEMIHEVRIVSMDGRPHLPASVRLWMGDSIGRWEGKTLVVDTTNFTGQTHFRGSDENLHLIERFTLSSPETLLYQFTIDDPTAFSRPWTAEIPMQKSSGPMYEFACHEGNVAMEHMLRTAREEEKAAEQSGKKSSR